MLRNETGFTVSYCDEFFILTCALYRSNHVNLKLSTIELKKSGSFLLKHATPLSIWNVGNMIFMTYADSALRFFYTFYL